MSHRSEGARIALVTISKWTETQSRTMQWLKMGLGQTSPPWQECRCLLGTLQRGVVQRTERKNNTGSKMGEAESERRERWGVTNFRKTCQWTQDGCQWPTCSKPAINRSSVWSDSPFLHHTNLWNEKQAVTAKRTSSKCCYWPAQLINPEPENLGTRMPFSLFLCRITGNTGFADWVTVSVLPIKSTASIALHWFPWAEADEKRKHAGS